MRDAPAAQRSLVLVGARFYAAEAAKVIQAFFRAAALTGRTLDHVLRWVANPVIASRPRFSASIRMPPPIGTGCCRLRYTAMLGRPGTRSPRCSRR
jgi:hypothetical protein